jgi:hypothetical protein
VNAGEIISAGFTARANYNLNLKRNEREDISVPLYAAVGSEHVSECITSYPRHGVQRFKGSGVWQMA